MSDQMIIDTSVINDTSYINESNNNYTPEEIKDAPKNFSPVVEEVSETSKLIKRFQESKSRETTPATPQRPMSPTLRQVSASPLGCRKTKKASLLERISNLSPQENQQAPSKQQEEIAKDIKNKVNTSCDTLEDRAKLFKQQQSPKTQIIKKSPKEIKKNIVKPANSNLKNGVKKVSNESNKAQFSIIILCITVRIHH